MNRLGLFTGSGIIGAILAPLFVIAAAFATGGDIFSAGALNADRGPASIGGAWAHSDLACSDCHTAPWSAERMGDRCLACHTDVAAQLADPASLHATIGANPANCRTCHPEHRGGHATLTLYAPDLYPHAEFGFYLLSHLRTSDGRPFACADCHADQSQPFTTETCRTCHLQIDRSWMEAHQLDFGFDCLACHDGIDSYGHAFDHRTTAFPLDGEHVDLSCAACHAGAMNLVDLRQTPVNCVDCHAKEDPHQGSLGTDCAGCHTPDGWKSGKIDHSLTAFPLVGHHAEVACGSCHVGGQLKGTPTTCVACHKADDPHQGKFGTDCAACHTPEDWSTIVDGNFDHSLTGFALTGAHARVATCAGCHRGGQFAGTPTKCAACHASDDAHSGRFGDGCGACHATSAWKPADFDHSLTGFALSGGHAGLACERCHAGGRYQGTPAACAACHASDDAHNGAFGSDCGRCHNPSSWKDATFDHSRTSFVLTGSHARAACAQCHVNGRFSGTPTKCMACHSADDAHNGANGTECGTCHDTTAWRNATIDHNRTAFPLSGRHQGVACQQCHANGVFKGTPTNCVACHASDDAHNGQFGTNCGGCHTTSGWSAATFDHGKTAFPLTGKHKGPACTQCHANGVYKGTPTACSACHASEDPHNGQFGSNCGSCHTTGGWAGATFDHGKTGFPLSGKHASAACTQCHANGVYEGTPTNCVACHASDDAHNGQFGTNCGSCHSASGWSGATFNHGNTGFPLTGAHSSLSCDQCHGNGVYQGTPTNCAGCHNAPPSHPDFYGSDCTRCHTTSSWSVKYSGSHTFPMNHQGAGSRCTQCHTSGFDDYTCTKCHDQAKTESKHAEKGITDLSDCAACHPTGKSD